MGAKKKKRASKADRAKAAAATQPVYLPDVIYVSDIIQNPDEIVSTLSQNVGWQISKHNIPDIWLETEGEGIVVAVLDTGCSVHHPDLRDALTGGYNVFDQSEKVDDRDGHGTHCTGTIVARNNDIGIVGVAPKAKVFHIKVLQDDGTGTMQSVADGVRKAVAQKVDIISMSLGGSEGEAGLYEAVKEAYNQNIPIICAAGNSGDRGQVAYPARYSETIAIGALNSDNLRAEFSQTGPKLDFMAPGVNILSTFHGDGYRVLSGTSMATPWVAGVVALMMAKHRKIGGQTPLHTVEDVREHLRKTSIDLDQAGRDSKTGFGLVDVTKALETLKPEPKPEPEPQPTPEPEPTPEPAPEPTPAPTDKRVDELIQTVNTLTGEIAGLKQRIAGVEKKIENVKEVL